MDVVRNAVPHMRMPPLHGPDVDDIPFPVGIIIVRCQKTVQTLRDEFRRPECPEQARGLLRVDGHTSRRYGRKKARRAGSPSSFPPIARSKPVDGHRPDMLLAPPGLRGDTRSSGSATSSTQLF